MGGIVIPDPYMEPAFNMSRLNTLRKLLLMPFRRHNRPIRVQRRTNQLNRQIESLEDRTVPATINVQAFSVTGGIPTTNDNDYTRINNAVQNAVNGDTIVLQGVFNWNEANASASWAKGSNGVVDVVYLDDYSIRAPDNLSDITLTAANPNGGAAGGASIQGPGDLPDQFLEGFLYFDGTTPNTGWTVSNLHVLNFELGIGMFVGADTDFSDTTLTNNTIQVATDNPADGIQSIGIQYSLGTNQTFSNNTIRFAGNGSTPGSTSVGMQSNFGGSNTYDGLLITGNVLQVQNAQSAVPETIIGIWENGQAHSSNITVSNNSFTNLASGNKAALNNQAAFRVTSQSSDTTAVVYSGNTATGANIGIEWLPEVFGSDLGGNQPVQLVENILTGNATGVLVQSNGSAILSGNNLSANTVALVNNTMGTVDAANNWWGSTNPVTVAALIQGAVDFSPFLNRGADFSAAPGFQGDFSDITVHTLGEQIGKIGRLQEGVDDLNGTPAGSRNLVVQGGDDADLFEIIRVNGASDNVTWNAEGPVAFSGFQSLTLNGNNGGDTFNVRLPNAADIAALVINGGNPTVAPGDTLNLDLSGLPNPFNTGGSSGNATATGGAQLSWTGIETLPPQSTAVGRQFDMQLALSNPVQAGSLPVIRTTTYNSLAGYGWTNAPTLGYDFGTTPDLIGNPLANTLRDGVEGTNGLSRAGIFRIDFADVVVAPVNLEVFIGDAYNIRDQIQVAVSTDGVNFTPITPVGGITALPGTYPVVTATVTPGGAGAVKSLWVRVADLGGQNSRWNLSGIHVNPVEGGGGAGAGAAFAAAPPSVQGLNLESSASSSPSSNTKSVPASTLNSPATEGTTQARSSSATLTFANGAEKDGLLTITMNVSKAALYEINDI